MKVDCQWGRAGASRPADVAIIVDVLSFSTCVSVAVEREAKVFPFFGSFVDSEALAAKLGAVAASKTREKDKLCLSPGSLQRMEQGQGVVLPSPNGSRCSLMAGAKDVLCGCLRNAEAVAAVARDAGDNILVVPAGELWREDGALRVAFEDMMGAGAIISYLGGDLTPEARATAAAFADAKSDLREQLFACPSGVELVERGFPEDVELAVQLNASKVAPLLTQHRMRYRDALPSFEWADKRVRYYENAAA